MAPKPKKANFLTLALVLVCTLLTVVLAVLVVRISELAFGMAVVEARGSTRIVTPTPQPAAPGSTPTETPMPTETLVPSATPTQAPTWTPSPTSPPTATPTPYPTLTPTPLPRLRPTAVDPGILPTQPISVTYPIPTAVPRYPISEDALTVVLLGNDQRPDWSHWNTDAIQYAIIYPKIPSVALISIPRDLYVYIPQFFMSRINTAHMYGEQNNFDGGGFGLLNQTLLYNLGITADYYAMVNFEGLKGIVDALGGIDVPVHCHLEDYWPYPDENGEFHRIALEPGVQHMNGELALWYSRTRKTTSVFNREERQQQVLEAIWRKARENGLLQSVPALYNQYGEMVKTDLTLNHMISLALLAAQIEPSQVTLYNIGPDEVEPYVTIYGGNVYLPKWEEIGPLIDRAMLPPSPSRAALASVKVEIWNGSGHEGWDLLAADSLYQDGYTPVLGTTDGQSYPQTTIQVFGEHAKGTGIASVQEIFGVDEARVSYLGAANGDVRLRVILGTDYQPCR